MPIDWPLVAVFAAAAVACFAVAYRGSRLSNPDSQRGLRWLLIVVGAWAALQTGGLLVTDESVATAVYTLSLVVGFATIGPWLYFCSAYTGNEYHRRPTYRAVAVGTYLVVVAVKLTNPIHGLYFSTMVLTEPTTLLLIDQGVLYWLSFGLSYALTGIGFLLLYWLSRESARRPWRLVGLFVAMGAASVPKFLNLLAPSLVPALSYEPLGVAVFAVGTSYFVEEQFLAEERATRRSFVEQTAGGVLVLDEAGRVREHNERAAELFPVLDDAGAEPVPIEAVSESVAANYRKGRSTLVEVGDDDDEQTYLVTGDPLRIGEETFGYTLLARDVTTLERQRKRLKRHERQLSDMAGAIAHELRNSVTVTNGYLEAAAGQLDAADPTAAHESVETARDRVRRMERIVEDLHALVRYTHDAGEPRFVDFEAAVRDAAAAAAAPNSVVVESDGAIRVAPTRFKQTAKNALRFAAYNRATMVTFTLREDGFDVRDDGRHCAAESGDRLFEYESAEPAADAGMSLPNVRALARIEGWSVSPNETYTDGMAYRVRGASVRPAGATDESPKPEPVPDIEQPQ